MTHAGTGVCYIEFGGGRIGRVDVDFFSDPDGPTGTYHEPFVRDARRQGALRFEPPRPLVWAVAMKAPNPYERCQVSFGRFIVD